jgi:small subunit ribosomal protein S17
MSAATAPLRGKRKVKVGRVVSDKMDKTIVVSVERLARHRIYKRVIRLTTKFKAHDERNEAHIGDTVRIEEARPLSATKRWRLVEIVARAGEHAGETIVAEEPETAEAIHMAAHPRREAGAEDGPVVAVSEAETEVAVSETAVAVSEREGGA